MEKIIHQVGVLTHQAKVFTHHFSLSGWNISTVLRCDVPSKPPTAYICLSDVTARTYRLLVVITGAAIQICEGRVVSDEWWL